MTLHFRINSTQLSTTILWVRVVYISLISPGLRVFPSTPYSDGSSYPIVQSAYAAALKDDTATGMPGKRNGFTPSTALVTLPLGLGPPLRSSPSVKVNCVLAFLIIDRLPLYG